MTKRKSEPKPLDDLNSFEDWLKVITYSRF